MRLAVEHLMRSKPPRIIIATTTLAQGVNVGISSVIVASPYISQETIDKRDFWNICGRAGRAFVDGEGKILYAIDDTRARWQIEKDEDFARGYFNSGNGDRVESGVLFVVQALRKLAAQAGVSFDVLLEIAANNDFSRLGTEAKTVEEICDPRNRLMRLGFGDNRCRQRSSVALGFASRRRGSYPSCVAGSEQAGRRRARRHVRFGRPFERSARRPVGFSSLVFVFDGRRTLVHL